MLTVFCEKNRIIWAFPTASKITPICIIHFILTTLKNEQHPCKRVRVDKYSDLEKSTDVINLIVDDFNIFMETTGDDASWLNGKNEIHNRRNNNMVREGLLDINKH